MNNIIEVRRNQRELIIESNSSRDSTMRFCRENDENGLAKYKMRDKPGSAVQAALDHTHLAPYRK